jgi:hypothetical protein
LSRTRRPTTSETRRRSRRSSRNWGGKRMRPGLLIRWACQYRTMRRGRGAREDCPGYPQGAQHGRPAWRAHPCRFAPTARGHSTASPRRMTADLSAVRPSYPARARTNDLIGRSPTTTVSRGSGRTRA